jgi:hypothetical protein
VTDGCIGTYIDPHVKGAKVHDNHFSKTNPICANIAFPQFGIIVDGASNSDIRNNVIEGQSNGGTASDLGALRDGVVNFAMPSNSPAGGLFLFDRAEPDAAISSDNVVKNNVFSGNDVDILVYSNGTHNKFEDNSCSKSDPDGLCKKHGQDNH